MALALWWACGGLGQCVKLYTLRPQASEAAGFDDARQWEQQVEDGVTRLGPQLPPAQLAAVLQHLGRLSWASSSGALLERLLPCLLQAASQLSAPELAGSLWAAAKVGGPDLTRTPAGCGLLACQHACVLVCVLCQPLPAGAASGCCSHTGCPTAAGGCHHPWPQPCCAAGGSGQQGGRHAVDAAEQRAVGGTCAGHHAVTGRELLLGAHTWCLNPKSMLLYMCSRVYQTM